MTNSVLQLQEDPTALIDALIKVAETQNNHQNEWSINGAAFIVVAIFGFIIFGSVFGLLIRSILNQQKQMTLRFLGNSDLLTKFQASFDKNTEILNQVSDFLKEVELTNSENAKKETTTEQLHCAVKEFLNAYKFRMAVEVQKIIDVNNITNKEKTKQKIENLLINLHTRCIQNFNAFNFRGSKVGDLIDNNNWRITQYGLIYDYIYNDNRDLNKFYNDLDLIFDSIFNEIRKKVDF